MLIENVLAAFEMEEILYELRDHSAGLNAGRWDYIFSAIKKFRNRDDFVLPDRSDVTMTVPFMRAYTELLVTTCHKRGAHAMGGMAAFIPNRRDPEVTEHGAREGARRQAARVARRLRRHLGRASRPRADGDGGLRRRARRAAEPDRAAARRRRTSRPTELLSLPDTPGEVTEAGIRTNVSVGIRYLASWLNGNGAAAIDNLMEDAATAEISRSQLWQWVRNGRVSAEDVRRIEAEELEKIGEWPRIDEAASLFEQVALADEFVDFLTLPAYELLD